MSIILCKTARKWRNGRVVEWKWNFQRKVMFSCRSTSAELQMTSLFVCLFFFFFLLKRNSGNSSHSILCETAELQVTDCSVCENRTAELRNIVYSLCGSETAEFQVTAYSLCGGGTAGLLKSKLLYGSGTANFKPYEIYCMEAELRNLQATIFSLLCLDCQRPDVPLPHFRSALTAKDLKFRFCSVVTAKDLKFHVRTFVLHWLPKNVKFRFRTSALPWLPNMWSSASALPLCLDWQSSEVPLSALVLPGLPKMWSSASAFHLCLDFQRFAVSLLHFRSVLTAKDLKVGFSTNTLPSLTNMGSSAKLNLCPLGAVCLCPRVVYMYKIMKKKMYKIRPQRDCFETCNK